MNNYQPSIHDRGLSQVQSMQIPSATVKCRAHEQSLRHISQDRQTFLSGSIQISTIIQPKSINEPKGIYDAYVKTCQRWNLGCNQQVVLLGLPENSIIGWRILNGQLTPLQPDQEDRAKYIVGISLGLGALFGESVGAELDWLNQPRKKLDGKSPLSYMLDGHMINLLTIVDMVKRERGL